MAADSRECSSKIESKLNPFSDMKLASFEALNNVERRACAKCKSSRKYYCYKCYVVVGIDRSLIPVVKLPLQVHIVKHQLEVDGKSTSSHAAIMAAENVVIHDFPDVPEFKSKEKVVLVYPCETALTLSQLGKQSNCETENINQNIEEVVFIDSTWQQAHKIITDKRLENIQRIKIEDAKTYFWRTQRKPNTCLATIEAVYYFFKEYDKYILEREYDGRYDNLLYLFAFQYQRVQQEQRKSKRRKTSSMTDKQACCQKSRKLE
ncbi:DTW domain-containing protein 1-like isoform X2 [Actinia tenebrosa]|uniref:tRNA-uridine aminocarboxypropyltransferase 1 n=1 Tax=Actinia tenebrosa TaxID=6105 RepID=A0A6P8ICB0_ACTTE|nr:DTW domain-containing protein 1-like isoform X2 [Actinia tenebrosa]